MIAKLARLQLYVRTVRYLRASQLRQMIYRRVVRRNSRPHAALDRTHARRVTSVRFPLAPESKDLDRRIGARPDGLPAASLDWRNGGLWQPLRCQPHYFEYLHDPALSQAWKRATLSDWIERNPLGKSEGADAWMAYAVSLRIVNWIKYFMRAAPQEVDARWLASLYDHALWLEANLELHILANHYLKNAKALLFAGLYFSGPDAERWWALGKRVFLAELREQFLADGGHYERSPMYHSLAVEDVLDVFTYVASGAGCESADTLETLRARAVAGLDFVAAMLLPDGTLPLFNDSAAGVAPAPAELFAYARETLGYEPPGLPRELVLRALRPSGYYVIAHGRDMLVIDCGPPGPAYQPGHAHCDLLSYELALDGERVVVDAGVLNYDDNAARRYARSTAAHNTVQIDALEQSEMWHIFRVARRAAPLAPSLSFSGPGRAAFYGAHDGFARSAARAIHRRDVRYEAGGWFFEDRVDGVGRHRVESRVHLRPGLGVRQAPEALHILRDDGRPLADLRPAPGVAMRLETAPHYPRFGTTQQSNVIVIAWEGDLPATLGYAITSPAASATPI